MRLGLVGTELSPAGSDRGAIELLLWGWAGELARRGHDVRLFSFGQATCEPPEAFEIVLVSDLDELVAKLAMFGSDVIVLNNRPDWARLLHSPVVHVIHNAMQALAIADRSSTRINLQGEKVLAVSRWLSCHFAEQLGLSVIPDVIGSFVAREFSLGSREYDRDKSEPDIRQVFFPNRLMIKKGVRVLLEALDILGPQWHGKFPDYISPWEYPTEEHCILRAEVEKHPRAALVPALRSRIAMAKAYRSSDVVAIPSIEPEGLGLAAIEAQVAGIPVVASDIGGLSEAVFEPNECVVPGDPSALASALLIAPDRQSISSSACSAIYERFNLVSSTNQLEAALLSVS
ncbi:MAG TPA: glycosyltransferase family 4 protein [Acidimicrobiales bacterium]|nr:glycosyltransferase family 4 protein [Acidimicrobiales bacterium]